MGKEDVDKGFLAHDSFQSLAFMKEAVSFRVQCMAGNVFIA